MPAVLEAVKRAGEIYNGDLAVEVVGKQLRVHEVVGANKLRRIAYSDTFMGGRYLRFDDATKGKSQDAKDFTVARLYSDPSKTQKIIEKYFPTFKRVGAQVHMYYSGHGPSGTSGTGGGYFTVPLGRSLLTAESIDEVKGIPKQKKYKANKGSREYKLGQRAFEQGKSPVPAQSVELMKRIKGKDYDTLMQMMTDYAGGWHAANVAAPVEGLDEKRIFLPGIYKGPTYKVGDEVMIVRRFGWKRGYTPTAIKPPVPGKVVKRDINVFYPKGPAKLTLRIKPEDYDRASPGVVHTSANEIIVQADEVRLKKKNESIEEAHVFKPGQRVKVASLKGRIVSKVENDTDTIFDDEYLVDFGPKGKHKIKADVIRAEADKRPAAPIVKVLRSIGGGAKKLMAALRPKAATAAETVASVSSIIRAVKGAGFTPTRIRLNEGSFSQPLKDHLFIVHDRNEGNYVVAHSVHADPMLGYQELETGLSAREAQSIVRRMKKRWKNTKVHSFSVTGHGHKRKYVAESRSVLIKALVEDAVKAPENKGLTLQQILRKLFKGVDEATDKAYSRPIKPEKWGVQGFDVSAPGRGELQVTLPKGADKKLRDKLRNSISGDLIVNSAKKMTWLLTTPTARSLKLELAAKVIRGWKEKIGWAEESVDEQRKLAGNLKLKEEVNYRELQEDKDGNKRCGDCAFVTLPDACKRVRGKIDQDFTCDLWKKGIAEDLDEELRLVPGDADDIQDVVAYMVVNRVVYDDKAPWAKGLKVLKRLDKKNWEKALRQFGDVEAAKDERQRSKIGLAAKKHFDRLANSRVRELAKFLRESVDEDVDPLVKKLDLVVDDNGNYKGDALLNKEMMGGTGVKVGAGRVFVEYIPPDIVSLTSLTGNTDRFTRKQAQRHLTKLQDSYPYDKRG